MENVYEIKKNKNLNYILPKMYKIGTVEEEIYESIIIVIHIYYYESIENFIKFINNIPDKIFLFVTVSEEHTKQYIDSYLANKNKIYKIIMKENRGRDISSLLVAARKEILKYKYVCFLHDKKEKNVKNKKDTEQWSYCLWENSIGSKSFIENIMYIFSKNKNIGLLVPPPPITENFAYGYSNSWGANFSLTCMLADKMNLKCDLNEKFPPIALGTVFWARTTALFPLLQINWKYSNFDPEPLANDGTLSHAIERILPYVAQDVGYETGWIMTDQYAAQQFVYQIDVLGKLFEILKSMQKIKLISEAKKFYHILKLLPLFCVNFNKIYIYGAGQTGRRCFSLMISLNITPDSFIVTDIKKNENNFCGILVQSIESVNLDNQCGVIIAVDSCLVNEIHNKLLNKGVLRKHIFVFG